MKKTLVSIVLMFIAGTSMAQVDTFSLHNMPLDYYIENGLDPDQFHGIISYHDQIAGGLQLSIGVPYCSCSYGYDAHQVFCYDFWNLPNINNFAVGVHADTAIRVRGIAMFYPRTKLEQYTWVNHNIRREWIEHGRNRMTMQLMDIEMNVQAEGFVMLSDSIGKPVFQINRNYYGEEVYEGTGTHLYSQPYDVYEAFFPEPVTVTDSFYLSIRLDGDSEEDYYSVSVPGIYECCWALSYYVDTSMIGISHDDLLAITYIFPKINWKARGEYRYIFDTVAPNNTLVYEHVDDDSWFFLNNCEDNHGYMLIFPILDIDCGMPGEASWTATDDGTVRLSWEPGSSASQWEVSYGPSGALPGDDSVVTTATPLAILHDITPGTHYVAYIRSLCTVRDTTWSDWTDSVSIFIPDPTGILEAEDSKTGVELTPNPATGEVRIASGIEMMQIEVYDEKGGLLRTLPASGLSADLDVSSWPRGTYLLRILTPAGPTTKKLLVQ